MFTTEDYQDFLEGYLKGLEAPGDIWPKEQTCQWAGHFWGQIEGMTAAFAAACQEDYQTEGPETAFSEFEQLCEAD